MNSLNDVYLEIKKRNSDIRFIKDDCMMLDINDAKRIIIMNGKIEVNYRRRIYGVDYWDSNVYECANLDELFAKLTEILDLQEKSMSR